MTYDLPDPLDLLADVIFQETIGDHLYGTYHVNGEDYEVEPPTRETWPETYLTRRSDGAVFRLNADITVTPEPAKATGK